jgi:hypothetical protein
MSLEHRCTNAVFMLNDVTWPTKNLKCLNNVVRRRYAALGEC